MKNLYMTILTCSLALGLMFSLGCGRSSAPPTPLTAEELPTAMEQAFSKAKPEIKELAAQVVAFVQGKEYSKAFQAMQTLTAKPGLTKDQLKVTSRATLTVNELLQAAQTQGDAKAAQTLKTYRLDK